jgi:hypothetical protein
MFLSNPTKIFLTGFIFVCCFSGCGYQETAESNGLTPPSAAPEFPFSTSEPEIYQAEIVISANGVEQKIFVARSGPNRRVDYDFGGPNQRSILENDKKYLISFRNKIYAEAGISNGDQTATNPLADELLNVREFMDFERLGEENGLTKYRARVRDSDASEVIINIDEPLGLPVKQEFFSINGEERTLEYSVELKNIRREIDAGVFEIPQGFRQTSIEAFQKLTAGR